MFAVAKDVLLDNKRGGMAHLRSAMLNGAPVAAIREVLGLVIMETGMVWYKLTGFDFLIYAEKVAAELEATGVK